MTERKPTIEETVIELMKALRSDGSVGPHDEHCEDDIRTYGVNACTQAEIIAKALADTKREFLAQAAKIAQGFDKSDSGYFQSSYETGRTDCANDIAAALYREFGLPAEKEKAGLTAETRKEKRG